MGPVDVEQPRDAAAIAHHVLAVRVVAPAFVDANIEQVVDEQSAFSADAGVVDYLQRTAAQDAAHGLSSVSSSHQPSGRAHCEHSPPTVEAGRPKQDWHVPRHE